jgi:hypothetical protein
MNGALQHAHDAQILRDINVGKENSLMLTKLIAELYLIPKEKSVNSWIRRLPF